MTLKALLLACSIAWAVAAGAEPLPSATSVATAIEAGRFDQAKLMIARLQQDEADPRLVDRLSADLVYAEGKDAEALARYSALLEATPGQASLCEPAGIAALRLGKFAEAETNLECAIADPNSTWRAWNARAVLADWQRDWPAAAAAYRQALSRDEGNARVLNNMGFSSLLQGDWQAAIGLFERANARDPSIGRIANNLELARAASARNLPRRLPRESDRDWAARLNDAGVAAQLLGDRERAIASFTRALETSDVWFERAANNLQAVKQ